MNESHSGTPVTLPDTPQNVNVELTFDLFTAFLGGISLSEFEKKLTQDSKGITAHEVNWWRERFQRPNQFLFGNSSPGSLPVEVLFLKIEAFKDILSQTQRFYLQRSDPLLNVDPKRISVSVREEWGPTPFRWNFRVNPLVLEKEERVPGAADSIFAAPPLINIPFQVELLADCLVKDVREKEGQKETELSLVFSSPKGKFHHYGPGDTLKVSLLTDNTEAGPIDLRCTITEVDGQALHTHSKIELNEHWKEKFVQRKGSTFYDTQVVLYKKYPLFCDAYSLGKVFIATLLSNDTNLLPKINEAVESIVNLLEGAAGDKPDIFFLRNRILSKISEYGTLFTKHNILYESNERTKKKNRIPDEIWQELFILIFRMLTQIKTFSLSFDDGEINTLLSELDSISSMLHSALFNSEAQKKELIAEIDSFTDQWDQKGNHEKEKDDHGV